MPYLISALLQRDPNLFSRVFHVVDQAKLDSGGVLGKNRKVHPVTRLSCVQRIRLTEKRSYGSHKRAAHLSGIEPMLAMRMASRINPDAVVFD